jgi:hypothetical protein
MKEINFDDIKSDQDNNSEEDKDQPDAEYTNLTIKK